MGIFGNKINRLRQITNTRCFIDFGENPRTAVFLAGTGRSGTTWISNIINYKNDYRYIFEPFRPSQVPLCGHFANRQYLRPEDRRPEYVGPARAILSGKIRNRWTDERNERLFCHRRLIKDIRANLMLRWLHDNFPGIPIILLFRHPCAVANSKLRKNWETHLDDILGQEALVADFLGPFKDEIGKAETVFEKYIFLWCIENYVPLKQFGPKEIHLAFYENFCETPKSEIDRLFSFLGREYDERIWDQVRRPSAVSRRESAVNTGESLTGAWRKHISARQTDRAVEILSLFGLDRIYGRDTMPDIENACAMMGQAETKRLGGSGETAPGYRRVG